MSMFGTSSNWVRRCLIHLQQQKRMTRTFCNDSKKKNNDPHFQSVETYRDLENLDFTKAAKILFSTPPPNKNKFGLDFHLVQLFFALMPSLAVYLVAQYARYDMRKMEAELELKKKAEEEQKAKEMEAAATEEKEVEAANPELLKVKERLEALEDMVKEIVVETKNKKPQSESIKSKNADQNQERVDPTISTSVDASKNQQTTHEATPGPPQKQFDSEKIAEDGKK